MKRPRNQFPGSDDPMSIGLGELDDKPRREAAPRPSRIRPGQVQPARDGFPPCPAEFPDRTWRLTRQFVEAGDEFGVRRISPWYFAKEFAGTIKHSPPVMEFILANGQDLAEDIFGRMIRLFWKHYVDSGTSKTRVLDLFLEEYWLDLFDQAKTQYTTDLIQRDRAAGTLKVHPQQDVRSLLKDADYQTAQEEIRVQEWTKEDLARPVSQQPARDNKNLDELLQRLRQPTPNSNPEASSEALSGRVSRRGSRGRGNTSGDPRQP